MSNKNTGEKHENHLTNLISMQQNELKLNREEKIEEEKQKRKDKSCRAMISLRSRL